MFWGKILEVSAIETPLRGLNMLSSSVFDSLLSGTYVSKKLKQWNSELISNTEAPVTIVAICQNIEPY